MDLFAGLKAASRVPRSYMDVLEELHLVVLPILLAILLLKLDDVGRVVFLGGDML